MTLNDNALGPARGQLRGRQIGMTKSIDELCREQGIRFDELVERSGLEHDRVQAIFMGRWTASPSDRQAIASALAVTIDDISWGHKTPVQHLWG